jgi:hypothetical protein
MAYTILLRTPHGWTDNLGNCPADANRWATTEAAQSAISELHAVGITGEMKPVHLDDLGSYDLIA